MYIVKNISKTEVSIPELRVNLAPNDQIDLDMVSSRFYIDQSSLLKRCLRNNALKCIFKDDGSGAFQIKRSDYVPENVTGAKAEVSPSDVVDAVKQLEEKLTRRLEERVSTQPQVDVNLLNQALAALQGIASQAGQNKTTQPSNTEESDDPRTVDIHKRTLNRLTNKAETSVRQEEQRTDSSDVMKNTQELEGLL